MKTVPVFPDDAQPIEAMERTQPRKGQVDRFIQRFAIDCPKMEDEPEWSFTGTQQVAWRNRGFRLNSLRQHEVFQ
jgi:hypothetical protein